MSRNSSFNIQRTKKKEKNSIKLSTANIYIYIYCMNESATSVKKSSGIHFFSWTFLLCFRFQLLKTTHKSTNANRNRQGKTTGHPSLNSGIWISYKACQKVCRYLGQLLVSVQTMSCENLYVVEIMQMRHNSQACLIKQLRKFKVTLRYLSRTRKW